MPQIRVMNWNIESLSINKINIAGMTTAIARTVAAANVDILIVLEVKVTRVAAAMTAVSNALNAADGGGNNWRGYFLSYKTGGEFYCVFIRNLNLIRPMYVSAGPPGTSPQPLTNMKANVFSIWPTPNWATNAYGGGVFVQPYPRVPICDAWATPRNARAAKQVNFGGQPIGAGGYSLGRGYRLPGLALFWIHNAAGDTVLPVLMCHYAAVRSRRQRNNLAQSQVNQMMNLQMPQYFNDQIPFNEASQWLQYRDAAGNIAFWNVNEICITGDFNLNFLENSGGVGATNIQLTNHFAYMGITPTIQQGGSAAPAAAAGVPVAMPGAPYAPPYGNAPVVNQIREQELRSAVTTQGTIMNQYPLQIPPPAPPPPPAPYVSSAFDNFFYGGARLNTAAPNFGTGGVDSGEVMNVPNNIVMQGGVGAAGQVDLSAVAAHYAATNTKNAQNAPNLQVAAGGAAALDQNDRLVGARLISDHLPVILDFAVP
jgi:hypothetical protein